MTTIPLTVTIHHVANLPEKVNTFGSMQPRVVLHMMKEKWETQAVEKPGPTAVFEETTTFEWDGQSSLAVDLNSKDKCFAKGFFNVAQLLGSGSSMTAELGLQGQGIKEECVIKMSLKKPSASGGGAVGGLLSKFPLLNCCSAVIGQKEAEVLVEATEVIAGALHRKSPKHQD